MGFIIVTFITLLWYEQIPGRYKMSMKSDLSSKIISESACRLVFYKRVNEARRYDGLN